MAESDDEVEITGVKNDNSLAAFAHARHDCTVHCFSKTLFDKTHANTCALCYCYVCDTPASECSDWGKPDSAHLFREKHCHAFAPSHASKMTAIEPHSYLNPTPHSLGQKWMQKREAAKAEKKASGKDKEKKVRRAARLKKLTAAMDKVKVLFDCRCHVCNALRTFIADKKASELVATFCGSAEEDTAAEACFLESLKKEAGEEAEGGGAVAYAKLAPRSDVSYYSSYDNREIIVWKPGTAASDAKGARLHMTLLKNPYTREYRYGGEVDSHAKELNDAVDEDSDEKDKTVILALTGCKNSALPAYPTAPPPPPPMYSYNCKLRTCVSVCGCLPGSVDRSVLHHCDSLQNY